MNGLKKYLLLIFLVSSLVCRAQLNEAFSDGEFTSNPPWAGTSGSWIINSSFQLQSNHPVPNSSFFITTSNPLAMDVSWTFDLKLLFNTSSANYVDVYLISSGEDLLAAANTGYFIRVGNTQDEVSLYRKDAGGASIKIIDGTDGITNHSDNNLKIKLVRNAAGQFVLYTDATGTGNSYQVEGSIADAYYTSSYYFGLLIRQSSSGFFGKHVFDNLIIEPYVPDLLPPAVESITIVSDSSLRLIFSEALDRTSAENILNYGVLPSSVQPNSAKRDDLDYSIVHLQFHPAFTQGTDYTLLINGVNDLAGNTLLNSTSPFSFYRPVIYDVVIHEFLADPIPVTGLPAVEFIELKNRSNRTLDLTGWKIRTSNGSAVIPACSLPADSFLILANSSTSSAFLPFGSTVGVLNFPAINNIIDTIILASKEGSTIHAVAYASSWFDNPVKKEGGWSLEMIDASHPCGGRENWMASTHSSGGTPGKNNSVTGIKIDNTPPSLTRTYTLDSLHIIALYNETIDSSSGSIPAAYKFDNGILAVSAFVLPPLFNSVSLQVSTPLQKGKIYTLEVNGVRDCKNNIGELLQSRTGVAEEADSFDLVINEILFNPRPLAHDFIELVNRSQKIIDASKIRIGNRSASGQLNDLVPVSQISYLLFPGDYLVVNEEAAALKNEYFVKNETGVLTLPSFPSFPDDKGTVVITSSAGKIIDAVTYSEKWHFPLVTNPEGVSLERIDPDDPSQNPANWHSASSTSGYATPTYKNSQFGNGFMVDDGIRVEPRVFSPDNDGWEDVAVIRYAVGVSGFMVNIRIFDAGGFQRRHLVKNALLGSEGKWSWDGLDDNNLPLPAGIYILHTELFNLQGEKRVFRNTIVLAKRT